MWKRPALFFALYLSFFPAKKACALDKNALYDVLASDQAKLQRVFRGAFFPQEKYCTIEFKRHVDGTYSQERVVSSTGLKNLDTSCFATLNMALPFTKFEGAADEFYVAIAKFKFAPASCEVSLGSPELMGTSRVEETIARKREGKIRNIKIVETRVRQALPTLGAGSPKLWPSYQFLAQEELELGNLAQARANIQKAIKCQEKHPESSQMALSKSDLAQILAQDGQVEAAEKTFQEVMSLEVLARAKDSNYLLNLERYAKFLFRAGKYDQAQEIYNKIKEIKLAKRDKEGQ